MTECWSLCLSCVDLICAAFMWSFCCVPLCCVFYCEFYCALVVLCVGCVGPTLSRQPAVAYPLHDVDAHQREEDQRHGELRERIALDVVVYLDLGHTQTHTEAQTFQR